MSDPVRSETSHWRDVVWRDELLARIYQPGAASPPPGPGGKRAVVVDVHGGAWSSRDRTLGERYNEAVAAAGLAVVAIDFRDGRVARHPAAVQDVAAAVQWVRDHADDLGVDPARVALTGSSSGGHLALLAALTDTEVCFVGAFWPPVDPLSRYRYAHNRLGQPVPEGQAFDAANLVAATEAYFGDEQTMGEASIVAVLAEGRPRSLPPVWLVQAGADLNVPPSMIEELVTSYRQRGGQLELSMYPGQVHGFGHARHDAARRFQADLVQRLLAVVG